MADPFEMPLWGRFTWAQEMNHHVVERVQTPMGRHNFEGVIGDAAFFQITLDACFIVGRVHSLQTTETNDTLAPKWPHDLDLETVQSTNTTGRWEEGRPDHDPSNCKQGG